jgi:hypothetical protein
MLYVRATCEEPFDLGKVIRIQRGGATNSVGTVIGRGPLEMLSPLLTPTVFPEVTGDLDSDQSPRLPRTVLRPNSRPDFNRSFKAP